MRTLVWSSSFIRTARRLLKRRPELRDRFERAVRLLAENPFSRELYSHKLKGELDGVWACAIDHDYRILFEFVRNPESGEEEIFLVTLGTHDEVY